MDVDIYFNVYIYWYCAYCTCSLLLHLPVLYLLLVTYIFDNFEFVKQGEDDELMSREVTVGMSGQLENDITCKKL
jgi:hypothetical protein